MSTTGPLPHRRPTVLVFGNEKGGSGKSTAAMHVAVGLLRSGWKVGSIDLDARQGTFSRYMQRRQARGTGIPCPTHLTVERSHLPTTAEQQAEDKAKLSAAFKSLGDCDFIVVDTPGADTFLNRLGHAYADVLITPINDSFVDLDLLATVNPETHVIERPSIYAEMVWEQRKRRMLDAKEHGAGAIDWIVMRNRLGHTVARNQQAVATLLEQLAKRIGFRLAPGFGERVIFRELFLKGLTLLDMKEEKDAPALTMSHVAARQEVRALIDAIGPERLRGEKPAQSRAA